MDEAGQRRLKQIMAVHRAEAEQMHANLKKSAALAGKCLEEVVMPALHELATETAKYGFQCSVVPGPSPALTIGENEDALTFRVLVEASTFGARATYRTTFGERDEERSFTGADRKATLPLSALSATLITETFLTEFELWLRTQLPVESPRK